MNSALYSENQQLKSLDGQAQNNLQISDGSVFELTSPNSAEFLLDTLQPDEVSPKV